MDKREFVVWLLDKKIYHSQVKASSQTWSLILIAFHQGWQLDMYLNVSFQNMWQWGVQSSMMLHLLSRLMKRRYRIHCILMDIWRMEANLCLSHPLAYKTKRQLLLVLSIITDWDILSKIRFIPDKEDLSPHWLGSPLKADRKTVDCELEKWKKTACYRMVWVNFWKRGSLRFQMISRW